MTRLFPIACWSVFVFSLAGFARAVDGPDFKKEVAPILTKYCTGCHNDQDKEGKLSLQSYASLLKGGAKGGVITPGQVEVSRLVLGPEHPDTVNAANNLAVVVRTRGM